MDGISLHKRPPHHSIRVHCSALMIILFRKLTERGAEFHIVRLVWLVAFCLGTVAGSEVIFIQKKGLERDC